MKNNVKIFGLGLLGGIIPLAVFIILSGSNPSDSINGAHTDIAIVKDKNGFIHKTGFNEASPVGAQDFVDASESSVNSVVHITTTVVKTSFQRDPFYEFFYGPGTGGREFEQRGKASGSGVIITGDGYIVTNNHVIESASEIEVTLNDNRKYKATVVGADPSTDIAVLKIEEKNLQALPLGNSDNLKIGEWVLEIHST
jgi:serine protease Do